MSKRIILLVFGCILLKFSVFSQVIDEEENDNYISEWTLGVNFNTNAGLIGGFFFKYAHQTANPKMYHHFWLEAVNIKHPKEQRVVLPSTGNSFIPGKQNYLYVLRPLYGRELILFKKAREQGVQVNAIAAAGPSLAFVAPYLVRYLYPNGQLKVEQYEPTKHSFDRIVGTGGFTESLGQAQIQPGLSLKLGMSFEFGVIKSSVSGSEVGICLDWYPQEIVIIPNNENNSFYKSIYFTMFFGGRK